MNLVDLTIIGAGPTGLFAAFYAGLRDMSVRLVDSLPDLGGQLAALYPEKYVYDMPGFPKILAKDLAEQLANQALQFNPEICLSETATTLGKYGDHWSIGTDRGDQMPSKTILITAGPGAFQPTRLGLEEESAYEGLGVHYGVKRLADFTGKRVAVVGGGDSACDWALALEPFAASVTLIHRRDEFRAHEHTMDLIRASTVEIVTPYVVNKLMGHGKLQAVELVSKHHACKVIEVDDLVVNIGFKTSLGHIKDWGVETKGNQVVVDSKFRTNLHNVFAAGDVCTHGSKLKLIATGVGEAATAVCFAKVAIDPKAKLFPGHSSDRVE